MYTYVYIYTLVRVNPSPFHSLQALAVLQKELGDGSAPAGWHETKTTILDTYR